MFWLVKVYNLPIRGQAPDSEGGGVIWTRYSGGRIFFGVLLEGDRFFDLEGRDIL